MLLFRMKNKSAKKSDSQKIFKQAILLFLKTERTIIFDEKTQDIV